MFQAGMGQYASRLVADQKTDSCYVQVLERVL
jgi:hypothetical protein